MFGLLSYMLQEDASEDGAPTQQQGQQTDKRHHHIQELPCIALRWGAEWERSKAVEKMTDKTVDIKSQMSEYLHKLCDPPLQLLTVSRHVGVSTLLYRGLVL